MWASVFCTNLTFYPLCQGVFTHINRKNVPTPYIKLNGAASFLCLCWAFWPTEQGHAACREPSALSSATRAVNLNQADA